MKKELKYNDKEKQYRDKLIRQIRDAQEQRNDSYTELDDMDFVTYYEENKKAANSYLRPKKNKADTRIVTGTTQEKEGTLLSSMLQYNFEVDIEAFNKNETREVELGNLMQDMIRKSRQIEKYRMKRPLIYKELLDQGTCFVEDLWEEKNVIKKEIEGVDWNKIDFSEIDWKEKIKNKGGMCKYNLIDGRHIFLGDIHNIEIQEQPYVFTIDIIPYSEAEAIYGDWDRFKYVPKTVDRFIEDAVGEDYNTWHLTHGNEQYVEVVKYRNKPANEYQIMLNGVMMLPIEFPMVWGDYYNIAKGDLEPISKFFAYSKSIPAKTKVDQAVLDEMLRLIVLEMQKSFKPPMANNTGLALGKDIFMPGKMFSNIEPQELEEIGTNEGPTNPQINGYKILRQIIDSKSIDPIYQGQSKNERQTAYEVSQLQKQQKMNLGTALIGVMNLEWQLNKMRCFNILRNWTEARGTKYSEVKKDLVKKYNRIELKGDISGKGKGRKIIDFSKKGSNKGPKQVKAEENLLERTSGEPTKLFYIDPEKLRKTIDWNWQFNITANQKDNDKVSQALWFQKLQSLISLFGSQSLNTEYLKSKTAAVMKADPDKLFKRGVPAQPESERQERQSGPTANQTNERQTRGLTSAIKQNKK